MYLCQLLSLRECKQHPVFYNRNPWTNWRRRAHLRSQLKEISTARGKLVRQLEELDTQARAVHRKLKSLRNSNAPVSKLPDEVLAMVFEAGTLLDQEALKSHFGSLVSHVTRHWRNLALVTPKLWNKIYFIKPETMEMISLQESRERAAVFLDRSRSSPVEIYIWGLITGDALFRDILRLICVHIGHCRHLSIKDAYPDVISWALETFSRQAAPLLSSIMLSASYQYAEDFELECPLFPLGDPHLITAQLNMIQVASLPCCLPVFQYVTSLRLVGIYNGDNDGPSDVLYASFRDTLMALKVLNHLELELDYFSEPEVAPRLLVALPTTQYLHIHGKTCEFLDRAVHSFHAASLITLSLEGWDYNVPELNLALEEELGSRFPSLQHLILIDITREVPNLGVVARRFPGVERLTCKLSRTQKGILPNIDHYLDTIDLGSSYEELHEVGTNPAAPSALRWPKLHTIAVSTSNRRLDVKTLFYKISMLQDAGHPIRKLKLPKHFFGPVDMAYLGQIIEVDDFSLDWPMPFECHFIEP